MKFLLINPPVQNSFSFAFIPNGLLEVVSIFKSHGHDLTLIDLMNYYNNHFTKEDLNLIKENYFDAIFLGGFTNQLYSIRQLVQQIRKLKENTLIITGGIGYQGIFNEGLEYTCCDVLVCHEMFPVAEGLYKFIQSRLIADLPEGILYKDVDGKIYGQALPKNNTDLSKLPFPYYDLFNVKRILKKSFSGFNNEISLDMYTSRGCPFKCNYCVNSHPDFNMRSQYRFKETKRVIEEVNFLIDKFHVEHIYFTDEEFSINKKRALELCGELAKIDICWSTSNRVDTLDEEIVKAMKDSGCRYIYLGIETTSAEIHKMMNKKITLEKVQRGVDLLKKYNVGIMPNFMIGYFGETEETILDSVSFAKKNNLVYVAPFYTLYPSSRDYLIHKEQRLTLTEFIKRLGYSDISPFPTTNVTKMSNWKLLFMRNFAFATTKSATITNNIFFQKFLTAFFLVALYFYYFCIHSAVKAFVRRYMWPFLITMKKY